MTSFNLFLKYVYHFQNVNLDTSFFKFAYRFQHIGCDNPDGYHVYKAVTNVMKRYNNL